MSLIMLSYARSGVRAGAPSGLGVPNYTALPVASLATLPDLQPDWNFYIANVRSAPAGTAYTDPATGVRVVKVTDATTPAANAGTRPHYSSGGPFTSLPLDEAGTISVSLRSQPIFDIAPGGLPANWRSPAIGNPTELRFAFSRNPATPWRAYQLVNKTLHRINHVTGESDPGNGFPYDLTALCPGVPNPGWLTCAENDAALACQSNLFGDPDNLIHVTPSTETVAAKSRSDVQTAVDDVLNTVNEVKISEDGRYVLISLDYPTNTNGYCVWDTVTGHVSDKNEMADRGGVQWSHSVHIGPTAFAAHEPSQSRQVTAALTLTPVASLGAPMMTQANLQVRSNESVGYNHNSSQWISTPRWIVGQNSNFATNMNVESRRGAWSVHSGNIYVAVHNTGTAYGSAERGVQTVVRRTGVNTTDPIAATLRRATSIGDMTEDSWFYDAATRSMYVWALGGGEPDARYILSAPNGPSNWAIGALRGDGLDQRVICHHYSLQSNYDGQAFPHQSQCGRFIIWGADHGVPSGRSDTLIAEIPA